MSQTPLTTRLTRGAFLTGLGAFALTPRTFAASSGNPQPTTRNPQLATHNHLTVLFTGTGGADWGNPPAGGPYEYRANAGVLLNGRVLIDLTRTSALNLPQDAKPEAIFYTHSHPDHFVPAALAARPSVRRVHVHESWADDARRELKKAGVTAEVVPVAFGKKYEACGLTFMPLVANHLTDRVYERCAIYTIRGAGQHLLYATDTSGIPAQAFRYLTEPLTAIVMNAMIGVGQRTNRRIFWHSTPELVAETVEALRLDGKYRPPAGRPVWTTHLSKKLNGTHAEVAAAYPKGLVPARDGLLLEL